MSNKIIKLLKKPISRKTMFISTMTVFTLLFVGMDIFMLAIANKSADYAEFKLCLVFQIIMLLYGLFSYLNNGTKK